MSNIGQNVAGSRMGSANVGGNHRMWGGYKQSDVKVSDNKATIRGQLLVNFDGRNVFLVFNYVDNKSGKMFQRVGSLRKYVARKGQKLSTSMLTSLVMQFFDEVFRDVSSLMGRNVKGSDMSIDVVFKGSGWVRPSVMKCLMNLGFGIRSFTDASAVPHNGVRPKAKRRV